MNHKNNDDLPNICLYCEYASPLHNDEEMLCRFKGVVSSEYVCRKFIYDPLKRRPMTRKPLLTLDILDDGAISDDTQNKEDK